MKMLLGWFLLPVLTLAKDVPPEITPVDPVRMEMLGGVLFADFGQDAYGTLEIAFPASEPTGKYTVRLGEKLSHAGAIDSKPPGGLSFNAGTYTATPAMRWSTGPPS
jgi:hypothetical protein